MVAEDAERFVGRGGDLHVGAVVGQRRRQELDRVFVIVHDEEPQVVQRRPPAAGRGGLDDYVIKSAAHYVRLPAAVEAALRRAGARSRARRRQRGFDDMLSAIGIGVFRAGADGRLRDFNNAMLTFLGAASLDDARALDLAALLQAAEAAGAPGTIRVPRVDGGEVELRVSAGMIEEADGAWAIEGVARRVREP